MGLTLSSCDKKEILKTITEPIDPSATYYYYSYKVQEVIDAQALGYAANEFVPDCIYIQGDTLFISNVQSGKFGVELYSLKEHKKINALNSWTYNGASQTFNKQVEAIAVSDGKLYLANRGYCIDVFDLKTLDFITRIGDRNYQNWDKNGARMLDLHAMAIAGNYIITRMKNSVQVNLTSDVQAANYQKINYFARSSTAGFDVNNGFYPHQMVVDTTGLVFLADYGQSGNKKIQVIDTALIKKGANLTLTTDKTMALDFYPRGIALWKNFMYISAADGSIRCYDRTSQQFTQTIKTVSNYTLGSCQKLFVKDNTLWVTDLGKKAVVGVGIFKNAIEEYNE